ncbi:peptidylprolyl isomerase [Helicobacter acinonychis]|uniref:Peptidyl-prolyl cis-trans isomerase n=1 Tax=Helicobacter acinonychis (strain Sheeba) TaxID=382638 RepID=Q17YT2_HELAH|nr:peptidylprolyl isomerase [Helicobacter acinonychis]CAJ99194.1 peptidyl-prolyl cis-trans isomerase [Helicobacter acinonychis str. Sheeba]STP04689.1 peptidyl-prolyl cis-trans isomerase [Helicobacter acinonychis]
MKKGILSLALMGMLSASFLGAKPAHNTANNSKKTTDASAGVLATVDGKPITKSDFDAIKQRNPNFDFDKLKEEEKKALVEQAIRTVLVENEAKTEKLDSTPEFKAMIDAVKKQALVEFWAKKQAEQVKKVKIPEKEMQDFYNANKEQIFVKQEAHARHILVKSEDEAKRIISEIDKQPKTKREAKFIELANRDTIDPNSKNAQNGGDLGKFQKNQMAPDFSKAAFALTPGNYTKTPIKTEFGYHIIYLISKDNPVTYTYEQAKPTIKGMLQEKLFQERMNQKIEQLRKQAKIVINDKL